MDWSTHGIKISNKRLLNLRDGEQRCYLTSFVLQALVNFFWVSWGFQDRGYPTKSSREVYSWPSTPPSLLPSLLVSTFLYVSPLLSLLSSSPSFPKLVSLRTFGVVMTGRDCVSVLLSSSTCFILSLHQTMDPEFSSPLCWLLSLPQPRLPTDTNSYSWLLGEWSCTQPRPRLISA